MRNGIYYKCDDCGETAQFSSYKKARKKGGWAVNKLYKKCYFSFERDFLIRSLSNIIFSPIIHPSLAIIFVAIYPLAGWVFGMRGKRYRSNGSHFLTAASIIPADLAISITPVHMDIMPSMVTHNVTASFAESSAAPLTASIFPENEANAIPISIIKAQI